MKKFRIWFDLLEPDERWKFYVFGLGSFLWLYGILLLFGLVTYVPDIVAMLDALLAFDFTTFRLIAIGIAAYIVIRFATLNRLGLKNQKIVQSWSVVIHDGSKFADEFFEKVQDLTLSRELPGMLEGDIAVKQLRDQMMFAEPRQFLIVYNFGQIRDFRVHLGVRAVGKELQVSWYLVLQPGFLRRMLSRLLTLPKPHPFLWENLSVFGHQDLQVRVTVIHSAVKSVMAEIMERLGQDPKGVDTRSRGVLELW